MMRCCCDKVGGPLVECKRCGMPVSPTGRSVAAASHGSYCNCFSGLADGTDYKDFAVWMMETKNDGLWPGERWGDSMPCLGDPKCEPKPREDDDE